MKYLLVLLMGFLLHKAIYEIANINAVVRYNNCRSKALKNSELSPYQQCKKNLEYNSAEKVLLYQPDTWEKFQ